MNSQFSQSGRLKRPTEKFQNYVQESCLKRKCKPIVLEQDDGDNHKINQKGHSISRSSARKTTSLKKYSCSHCGFTAEKKSSQDFIKHHHLKKDNKVCFVHGLIHCPNPDCDKVFLSELDMERHCTMTTSTKTKCLQAYRVSRTMSNIYARHVSSQVDLLPATHNPSTMLKATQFGTLCQGHAVDQSNLSVTDMDVARNFTSQYHNYNVLLLQQGNNRGSCHLATSMTSHSSNDNQSSLASCTNQSELLVIPGTIDGSRHQPAVGIDDNTSNDNVHGADFLDVSGDSDTGSENNSVANMIPEDVLMNLQHKINIANSTSVISKEEKACLSLEALLRNAGCPLYLYNEVMKWAVDHKRRIPSKKNSMINRDQLYASLSKKIHGEASSEMKPKEIPITLPSGRRCSVTVFNIYSQITSLLGNSDINKWSNYFFHATTEDPFNINLFSSWDNSSFNDIETSIWYQRTRRSVLKDEDSEILVPICLFIDGTVLSLSGSLSLEPVMMSLMIHNRETRKNPESWLPLGYIHDPTSIPGNKFVNPEDKYSDYHTMLSIVLRDLQELVHDSCNGLSWTFSNVPGKRGPVTKKLIFRLAFIIGDTKGHDILCGRMGSHNKTPGLCRDCDMVTIMADDPSMPCRFLKQSDLRNKTLQELKAMSFYRVPYFTFDRLSFGASPYGINCATAIDIIHGILIGMMEYLHSTFTDQLTSNQVSFLSRTVAFIATFCSGRIPGLLHCRLWKKGLSRKGILTAKMKMARCLLVCLALKSESFWNYLLNSTGKLPSAIQKMRNKGKQAHRVDNDNYGDGSVDESHNDSASEMCISVVDSEAGSVDISCTCSDSETNSVVGNPSQSPSSSIDDLSASSDDLYEHSSADTDNSYNSEDDSTYDPNKDIESRDPIIFTADVIRGWIDLFDNMLSLYGWLTSPTMPCHLFKYDSLSIAKHCTEKFMQMYKDVAYRFEGMGLKLTKFHQIRHWYFYISMYGVPTNFDSSFCESHHIHHTKKTGRRTQKRQDDLASQTAQRVYEANLLRSAIRRCPKRQQGKGLSLRVAPQKVTCGARFLIEFDYSQIDDNMNTSRNLQTMYQQSPIARFSWVHSRNKKKRIFSDTVLRSLSQKLAWFNNGNVSQRLTSIEGCTEVRLSHRDNKRDRRIVRAHPDYHKKGFWLDWVAVKWESIDDDEAVITLPAQVLMILDFDTASYQPIAEEVMELLPNVNRREMANDHVDRQGIHLMLHSAAEKEDPSEELSSICNRYTMEPFFQLVQLTNVDRLVFVARDPPMSNRDDETDFGISLVEDPKRWGDIFVRRNRNGYIEPVEGQLCLDEFDETHHPW